MTSDKVIENTIHSKTDYELYLLIFLEADQYTDNALEIAKKEYNSRQIGQDQEVKFANKLKTHLKAVENRKNVSASFLEKCACFFLPGLILFMALENLRAKGYIKKAKDLSTATKLGLMFYILLIVLSSL